MIFFLNSCGTSPYEREQQQRKMAQYKEQEQRQEAEQRMQEAEREAQEEREMTRLNYGPPPPKDYVQGFLNAVMATLIDPYSAIVRNVKPPKKGWLKIYQGLDKVNKYGWMMCGEMNGKNRFGGYVGFRPTIVVYGFGNYENLGLDDLTISMNENRIQNICYNTSEKESISKFEPPSERNESSPDKDCIRQCKSIETNKKKIQKCIKDFCD